MSTDDGAQIIPFPQDRAEQQTCFNCVFYTVAYCHVFDEPIDSELFAAAGCEAYETN